MGMFVIVRTETDWSAIRALACRDGRVTAREISALATRRDRRAAISWYLALCADRHERLVRAERRELLHLRYERIDPSEVPADVGFALGGWHRRSDTDALEVRYGAPGRAPCCGAPALPTIRADKPRPRWRRCTACGARVDTPRHGDPYMQQFWWPAARCETFRLVGWSRTR